MLVIDRLRQRRRDDDGAVLVTVVVVMFFGFLVATVIAGSVLFTIQGNSGNTQRTQAFIAAESGRDAAFAALTNAIVAGDLVCTGGLLSGSSDGSRAPEYTYAIRSTTSSTMPTSWDDLTASDAVCPTKETEYVVVQSTGSDAGSDVTIDAVYPWKKTPDSQPAGTMAYFDGSFTATKSTYTGDLVIRGAGNYYCNNGAGNELDGDLWILNSGLRSTSDCHVRGDVYVYGNVDMKNNDLIIDGDLITLTGDIDLAVDNVSIGGSIYSGQNLILAKSGTVTGEVKAVGTITDPIPAGWTHTDGTPIVAQPGQPAPVIVPSLAAVYEATKWLEFTATTDWGTDVQPYANVCSEGDIKSRLETTGSRAVFDMSGCGQGNSANLTIEFGNINMMRDALFVVPSGKKLTIKLDHAITKGAGDPQLIVVQLDSDRNDIKPTCTGGSTFSLSGGSAVQVRTMLYSPCGIGSTSSITLTGQLYLGSDGIHLNGGTFTCNAMSWTPAFNNLGCGVRGEGGVFDPDRVVVSLDSLNFQSER